MPAYGGAVRLARWAGKGNAMKAALGYPIDAEEAYRIGLAQWLVPHAELMDRAMKVPKTSRPAAARQPPRQGVAEQGPRHCNIRDASEVDILSLHGALSRRRIRRKPTTPGARSARPVVRGV